MSVIPALFRDAETDHPAIAQWCTTILTGGTARLLLWGRQGRWVFLGSAGVGAWTEYCPRRV
ncbi:hypothetical protein [Streptomyces halstedii]|uniref:hypothetical protein n=1 Tax=Streptomyces halstedii TaxID=1944 RepID=UPI00382D5DEE